jgi:hypothetical protein
MPVRTAAAQGSSLGLRDAAWRGAAQLPGFTFAGGSCRVGNKSGPMGQAKKWGPTGVLSGLRALSPAAPPCGG